jgi:hypothetical protein
MTKKLDPEAVYFQVGHLIETMPDLTSRQLTAGHHLWLGRAAALVEAVGDMRDSVEYRSAVSMLSTSPQTYAQAITVVLYRILAKAELEAPVSARGSFIPAGNPFDALASVGKVFGTAKNDLLLVDPYMNEKILTDFCALAPEGVTLRILSDQNNYKQSLIPAVQRWSEQYKGSRPVEARLAPPRDLHDRVIIADSSSVWSLTQSFKDLAVRSPATVHRVEGEAGALKVAAYMAKWNTATAL